MSKDGKRVFFFVFVFHFPVLFVPVHVLLLLFGFSFLLEGTDSVVKWILPKSYLTTAMHMFMGNNGKHALKNTMQSAPGMIAKIDSSWLESVHN